MINSLRFEKIPDYGAPKQRPSWIGFSLAIILIVSGALMFSAAKTDSGIMDELAHIPSGYGYVHELDFRLNPEHPPLLKAMSALPLLLINPNFPTNDYAWTSAVNGQWDMGSNFLYKSGNNADKIIFLSRIFPIILTLLLSLLIFLIAKDLFGAKWALLPTALFALSPSVLAHGHYVTTDIAAAFGVLLATYAFLGNLSGPSRKKLIWAGVAFGIAQLLKFSAVLLGPFFLMLVFFWSLFSLNSNLHSGFGAWLASFFKIFFKKLWMTFLVFLIGVVIVIYPAYFLFTKNYPQARQTADTEYILSSFAGGPPSPGETCNPIRCLAEATIWATKNPATSPLAEYALGALMVTQRAAGGNTNYFLGEISNSGSRSYFPIVFGLKETLPTLLFIVIALGLGTMSIWRGLRDRTKTFGNKMSFYFENNFAQFSFAIFIAFYWFMSMRSPLNIGFRHLMPTIPLFYLLFTSAWKKWSENGKPWLKKTLVAILLIWFFGETAFAAPNFLSYFNEMGGGTSTGYRYVTDSNYDWGQDFLRFKDWAEKKLNGEKIAVDYFGAASPEYYLPGQAVNWWSAKGDPRESGIHWLAVSVNTLEGAFGKPIYYFKRNPADEYKWLSAIYPPNEGMGGVPKPDFKAGTTIFIYRLP